MPAVALFEMASAPLVVPAKMLVFCDARQRLSIRFIDQLGNREPLMGLNHLSFSVLNATMIPQPIKYAIGVKTKDTKINSVREVRNKK